MGQPSVKKNYFFRLFYEILTLAAIFVTTPYVSRVLGADGVGVDSYVSSIVGYFTMFAALGTASYGAREIARHRDEPETASKLFWEIEILTVFTSLICLVLWLVVIVFSSEYRPYFLALTPMLFATMADVSWYFTGYEQIKYTVIGNSICKLLGIVLIFALVKEKTDILTYCVINSCMQLVGNLMMWLFLPRTLVKVKLHNLEIGRHFRETLTYFVPSVAISVYTVLDKTLIGVLTGSKHQNGYYEQANRVINVIKLLAVLSLNTVMGARMAYLFAEKKHEEIRERLKYSMDFILLAGIGSAFGISGIAQVLVPLFFGAGYEPVVGLLCLMSPLIVIIGISNCLGNQYYTPNGRIKQITKYIVLGATVNLAVNLILIPNFGAYGATVSSIIAEMVITLLYIRNSDGYITLGLLWRQMWKKLTAGTLMVIIVMAVGRQLDMSPLVVLVLQIIIGVCVYAMVLLLLKDSMIKNLFQTGLDIIKKRGEKG